MNGEGEEEKTILLVENNTSVFRTASLTCLHFFPLDVKTNARKYIETRRRTGKSTGIFLK